MASNALYQHRPVSAPPFKPKHGIQQNGKSAKTVNVAQSKGPLKKTSPTSCEGINSALEETISALRRGDSKNWGILCAEEIERFDAENALTALKTLILLRFSIQGNKSFCTHNKLLIQRLCSLMTPADLATLLSCFAKERCDNEPLIDLIDQEILGKMEDMNSKEKDALSEREIFTAVDVAKILHAHAKFGFMHPLLFAAFREFAVENIPVWPAKDLCQIAWSVAVLLNIRGESVNDQIAAPDLELIQTLVTRLEERVSAGWMTEDADLSQVLAFTNYLELFLDISEICPNLCQNLEAFAHRRSEEQPTSSNLHETIQNVLQTMMKITLEKERFIKGYFADIILEDHRIVEVNGPSHYLLSGKSCGDQALRTRILGKEGFHVTEIDYSAWDRCASPNVITTNRKRKTLLTKLVFAEAPMEAPPSTTNGHTTPLLSTTQ